MKKIIIAALLIVMLFSCGQATILSELTSQFRTLIGEPDTATAYCTNTMIKTWLNLAQQKIVKLMREGIYQYDYTYVAESLSYELPSEFLEIKGVMVREENQWVAAIPNPNFFVDTGSYTFFTAQKKPDTSLLYLRGSGFKEGDTIRIFYRKPLASMDTLTDTCEVAADLQIFVLEEAESYFEKATKNYAAWQALFQQIRIDMGLIKPK